MKEKTVKLYDGGESTCDESGDIRITDKNSETVFISYCDVLLILRTVEKLMNERV
jgi:hypothetical protein